MGTKSVNLKICDTKDVIDLDDSSVPGNSSVTVKAQKTSFLSIIFMFNRKVVFVLLWITGNL